MPRAIKIHGRPTDHPLYTVDIFTPRSDCNSDYMRFSHPTPSFFPKRDQSPHMAHISDIRHRWNLSWYATERPQSERSNDATHAGPAAAVAPTTARQVTVLLAKCTIPKIFLFY